jgi:O-antigen ligase
MKNLSATKLYTLAFGLFLGLCVWKFGNPVILDHVISAPVSPSEFLNAAWPTHWANWILLPLAALGAALIFQKKIFWNHSKWLWLLPLGWLSWQFISATCTVDAGLTAATLWQFFGCVACYFLGALMFGPENLWRWLLPGLLAAFIFCLVRGVDQHVYEYPQSHQLLVEGERCGWTNFPDETLAQMKTDGIIITTNDTVVANPVILAKFAKGRVSGTVVYPNALAGLILLLLPLAFVLAFETTKELKAPIRLALIGLTIFLGGTAFFWTGSKLGWLIGIGLAGLFLLRLNWPKKLKLFAVAAILIFGLGIFAVRFHHYFANGATSVSARLDYWRAAVQTTMANPALGTGPGTFQRPYAKIKAPESEMARLTHNDYLEQFSDSGWPGGLAYVVWIFLALTVAGKKIWRSNDAFTFAIFTGLIGWFWQGFGEFSLYIPALAWTAFTLLGCLIGQKLNQFDK